jgi:hypothetical protein
MRTSVKFQNIEDKNHQSISLCQQNLDKESILSHLVQVLVAQAKPRLSQRKLLSKKLTVTSTEDQMIHQKTMSSSQPNPVKELISITMVQVAQKEVKPQPRKQNH